jgi:hypothetical protein
MNRATRRRAARDRRRGRARWTAAEREAGLRELTSAALCKFTASIVGPHPDHILGFLAAAARGDDHAQSGMQAIGRWLSSAAELSPGEQHQCLFCRREFVNEMPIAFAIILPASDRTRSCAESVPRVRTGTTILPAAAVKEWRAIWPDLQPMKGGHA